MEKSLRTEEPCIANQPVAKFFQEFGSIPLLTAEQEKECARRMEEGDAQAANDLVMANVRFIASIAKGFARTTHELADLIQDGCVHALNIIHRFKTSKKCRVTTFLKEPLFHFYCRRIRKRTMVEVKASRKDMSKLEDARFHLTSSLGRTPTDLELMAVMGFSKLRLRGVQHAYQCLHGQMHHMASLDHRRANDDPQLNIAEPEDERDSDTSELVQEMYRVRTMMLHLDPRERVIVERHFGLNDQKPKTLKNIGEELGLTKERVRQIERKALQKLFDLMNEETGEVEAA